MSTSHIDDVCRKSSVYNQTGQNYFEQLSAYNHMSAHLRRILLARSVVDSRNKNYMRDKRSNCRSPIRSKSLDKILSRRDLIDGLAYDTEHHPIDVLRMSLESDRECSKKKKRIFDHTCECCNAGWYGPCRGVSQKTGRRRVEIKSEGARSIRSTSGNNSGSPIKYQRSSGESARPHRQTGSRSGRPLEIDRPKQQIGIRNESRTRSNSRSNRVSEVIDETYSYNSSFESSSDTSEVDCPVDNKKFASSSPRTSRVRSADRAGIEMKNSSDNVELTDEAKYAKFLYDITQEIMLNGLYTDRELHEIFKKHVEMNSKNLDRNKMLSEIYQLKMSLNVDEFSDDEDEENNIERFMLGTGKYAKFSPNKPPTPPKILDENKLLEKLRNHEESWRFEESRRKSKSSENSKNSVVLVDANPEIFVTERDVLSTLMDMKLDPRQVRTICKSLQSKSRAETPALSHTTDETALDMVQHDPSYSRLKGERRSSPIIKRRVEKSTFESYISPDLSRFSTMSTRRDVTTKTDDVGDGSTQTAIAEAAKKSKHCECQCDDTNSTFVHSIEEKQVPNLPEKAEESQSDEEDQPEVAVQTLIDSQTRGVMTSTSLDRIKLVTTGSGTESSEFQKVPEISQNPIQDKNDNNINKNASPKESPRVQSLENRKKRFSETDEEEQSGSMESDDKAGKKNEPIKKKRSSTLKRRTTTTSQKVETNFKSLSKLKKEPTEVVNKIDAISKTRRKKSSVSKQSVKSVAKKSVVGDPDLINVSEEPKDPDPDLSMIKSQIVSTRNDVETNISENSDATDTYIVTEKDSHVTSDHEKIGEITDNEMTSLSEEFFQIEESAIVEEISSIVDFENDEEIQIPEKISSIVGLKKAEESQIPEKMSSIVNFEKAEEIQIPEKISSIVDLKKAKESQIPEKMSSIVDFEKAEEIQIPEKISSIVDLKKAKESQIPEKMSSIVNFEKAEESQIPKEMSSIVDFKKPEEFQISEEFSSIVNFEKAEKSQISEEFSSIMDLEKVEESQNLEKISSIVDFEKAQASQIPEEFSSVVDLEKVGESQTPETLGKSEFVLSKMSSGDKLKISDEWKDEIISVNESSQMKKLDQILKEDSKESQRTRITKISSQISKHAENMNEETNGLTGSSIDLHEFSIDESSKDDVVDRSKPSSLELKRKQESDDEDVMISGMNADKNHEKEIRDKETNESRELSEKLMNTPSTSNETSQDDISDNRSQDLHSPLAEENSTSKKNSKRIKTAKKKICSACIGEMIGKSKSPNSSSAKLDSPRTSFKNENVRKRTTFLEERTTTVSDISLLRNENLDKSAQLSFENAPEVRSIQDEVPSYVEDAEEANQLPWMLTEKDLTNERQERLEVSAPRRDTIHRRTSLIRSLRIAVKNLTKRSTTGTSESRWSNSQEFSPELESSPGTTPLLESKEHVSETIRSDEIVESSWESSSNTKIEPESKDNVSETVQNNEIAKSSQESSSNAKIEPDLNQNIPGTTQRHETGKNSLKSSSNVIVQNESKKNLPETIQHDEITKISKKNISSSTPLYRSNHEISPVPSAEKKKI